VFRFTLLAERAPDAAVATGDTALVTTVCGFGVGIVARLELVRLYVTVAAVRTLEKAARTALVPERRVALLACIEPLIAARLLTAQLVATISGAQVGVVALFCLCGGSVPAAGFLNFGLAVGITTVPIPNVAVIASFVRLACAVATNADLFAAAPAATIPIRQVAVVTLLARSAHSVPAHDQVAHGYIVIVVDGVVTTGTSASACFMRSRGRPTGIRPTPEWQHERGGQRTQNAQPAQQNQGRFGHEHSNYS